MRFSKLIFFICMASLFLFSSPVMAEEDSSTLSVVEAKAAAGVEDREATGVSDTFSTNDTVTVWAAFRNPGSETNADIVWSIGDTEIHTYSMNIGQSQRWRTWAQLKVSRAGDWTVTLRDSSGNTLETVSFTVSDS